MKCVLLLSLVALCYSVPLQSVSPTVAFGEGGIITITGADGRKAVISGADKSKNVEILLTTPLGFKKLVKVDEKKSIGTVNIQDPITGNRNEDEEIQGYGTNFRTKSINGQSEFDILNEILRGSQGVVDVNTLENILTKLEYYVESGDLNPYVYEILKSYLENNPATLERLYLEQGDVTPRQVDYYQRLPLLQYLWNKNMAEQRKPYGAWNWYKYGIRPVPEEVQGPSYRSPYSYLYNPLQFRDLYEQQEAQQQYQQQLTQPQQQSSQVYRSLPWLYAEKPQQWVQPQQYSYGQQRPSFYQYLAENQLAQEVPFSREFLDQQQYYQPLRLSQLYQRYTPSELTQELYEPYEQDGGTLQWRQGGYSSNSPVVSIA